RGAGLPLLAAGLPGLVAVDERRVEEATADLGERAVVRGDDGDDASRLGDGDVGAGRLVGDVLPAAAALAVRAALDGVDEDALLDGLLAGLGIFHVVLVI